MPFYRDPLPVDYLVDVRVDVDRSVPTTAGVHV